ncbi:MAG: hypothetical protein J5J00_14295 [Deltaproteobacteria bacterium]|nr:hypothetical protein [Deltaproteobacteria bacterium]
MTHHQGKTIIKLGWPQGANIPRDEKLLAGVLEVVNELSHSAGGGDLKVDSITESHADDGTTFRQIIFSPALRDIAGKQRSN